VPDKEPTQQAPAPAFSRKVGDQEALKLKARQARAPVWSGLGMLGLIGWSVCLPTLLGTWLGQWLDRRHTGTHTWTLALLIAGLCLGCANAGHWISKEQRAIHRGNQDAG